MIFIKQLVHKFGERKFECEAFYFEPFHPKIFGLAKSKESWAERTPEM